MGGVFDYKEKGGCRRRRFATLVACSLGVFPGGLFSGPAFGQLVGQWKFDEAAGLSAADSSPTGNHGTLQGGATWTTGRINSALSFDGLTGYVQVGADLSQWLGGTASLSAWIRTTQIGKADFFRSPGITGVESAGNNNDIFWGWLDASGRIALQAGNGDSARSLNPVNDGQWHHVGLTRDATSGQAKVYVDGVLNATVISEPGVKTTTFYSLGRIENTAGTPGYLQGQLDEVRIYNFILGPADIQVLAGSAPPANQPPLPPTGVAAFGGDGQVTLTWNSSVGATSYNIWRLVAGGSTYTLANPNPVISTVYTNTGLVNGTSYYFVITAIGAAGESGYSQQVRATPSAVPAGFGVAQVGFGLTNPTQMEIAPDGRIFVAQEEGIIRLIKNDALLTAPVATLTGVDYFSERGLLGIAVDPGFATNHYLYVYYTAGTNGLATSRNRVSRLTLNGDVAVPGSETMLFELPPVGNANLHMGGAIHFGPDGRLYISVGDHLLPNTSQSLASATGKILRINPDGSIPTDNPFYNTPGAYPAIWIWGVRNPFTTAFQPGTGRFFINDVGQDTWEEIDDGVAGANCGWPTTEGFFNQSSFPNFIEPAYVYSHASGGCAITGGTFYNPPVQQFPAQYVGKYFFQDFCYGWIRVLNPANNSVTSFATFPPGTTFPTDMRVSPDGSLYVLCRSSGGGNVQPGLGGLYKIQYLLSAPPVITLPPVDQLVSPGQSATFHVSASGTQPLYYQWQRDSIDIPNGAADTYSLPSASLADDGAQFRCVVSNAFGIATSSAAVLTVTSNQPPVATIDAPPAGLFYNAGDTFDFSGYGTDPDEGVLPASDLTWQIDFQHDAHAHPFFPPTTGITNGTFTIPTSGETSPHVWYRIYLTVKDSLGLTNGTYREVFPNTATISLQTSPAGLQVKLDGAPTATATSVVGVVGIVRSLEAFAQTAGGSSYAFDHWSDGGAAAHSISFPANATAYTAFYRTDSVSDPSISYWKFDEASGSTAIDSSPTGNHGTLQGGVTRVSGKIGSALSFDGLTGYVQVGSDLNQWLGGTASLSAWIKTTQFGKGDFFRCPGITGIESVGNNNDIFWGWLDASGRIALQAGNGDAARSLNPINDGQWHHIALTRDANTGQVKVYVDGVLNGTAVSEPGIKTTRFFSLGRIETTGGSANFLQGQLDEVHIYNSVLSAADIQALANPPPPSQPPTINQPPVNKLVLPGQPAMFTVVATGTPPLNYQWQRNAGDVAGATSSSYTLNSTTLADNGALFRCVVSNAFGSITSGAATLTVTNDHPPVATITQPVAGNFFNAGDTILFAGTGFDQEDGTLSASALTWKVDVYRNGQASTVVPPTSGINGGSFFVPLTGTTSTDVWYRISLTARDSLNQSDTALRDLLPRTSTITLQTSPEGLQIKLDGQPVATATSVVGVVGLTRSLEAFAQTTGGTSYAFDHWSDGSAAAHNILFPAAATTYTAFYKTNAVLDQYAGYWKFDEAAGPTAFDSSPTGNHGTLQGGVTRVSGKINSALSFDGLTGYVLVGSDLNQWLGGTASLSAWIKTTQFGKGDFFRCPGITGVESGGDNNDIFWGWLDATGRIALQAGNGDAARSLNPINNGQWHHIVLTRDAINGQVKVYVDGVLNGTANSEAGLKTTKFYSLGRIESSGNSWQGALDDVRIYNFVLGASDIQTLAGLGVTQTTTSSLASRIAVIQDAIPVEWTQKYFGHLSAESTDSSGANDDPDGDGQNNLAEFLSGTDPTNAASCFRILSVMQEGNDLRVMWTTGLGKTNALQRAAGSFCTNDFTDIFIVTNAVSSLTNYLDTGAATSAPALYYRGRLMQ